MPASSLPPSAQTLFIEGIDAPAFMQSQFSSDVTALETGRWQFSAWLDAQGKVQYFFHLARIADERWLIVLRGGDANAMKKELSRYIFRSRVRLEAGAAGVITRGVPLERQVAEAHDDNWTLGCGDHSLELSLPASAGNASGDSWRHLQIVQGWPWLPEQLGGSLLPPSLSLHRLGAVALDKGCYPGQEIVARLHYRGGNKRHLHHVELSRHVAAGTRLALDTDERGMQLLDVVSVDEHTFALAVIEDRLAALMEANAAITFDDETVARSLTTWSA